MKIKNSSKVGKEENCTEKHAAGLNIFQALFNAVKESVFLLDYATLKIVAVNDSAHEIFGYDSKQEMLGLEIVSLCSENRKKAVKDLRQTISLLEKDKKQTFEWSGQKKDKTSFFAEMSLISFETDEGPGLMAITRDLTREKNADEILKARDLLFLAIEQLEEIVMLFDRNYRITYVNSAYEKATGYLRDEVIGQNPDFLKSGLHGDDFYQNKNETLARGEIWKGQFSNRRKNGDIYTEEAVVTPVKDSNGDIIAFLAVKQDVTEMLKLNREKELLENQFRQSQKMESIGRLAGGIAHDLNNLLTPILGYSEMLAEDFMNEKMKKKSAKEIVKATLRARDLVRQLLIYSRKQIFQIHEIEVNSWLKSFCEMLKGALSENIEFKLSQSSDQFFINGDLALLERVLMNLAINSRDAMPEGGLFLIDSREVWLDEQMLAIHEVVNVVPGRYVLIQISDTGCGIAKENFAEIFDPFFTTKDVDKGTGLGLSTVYGIVKQHKGYIWVYSERNVGTTFKIYLPLIEKSGKVEFEKTEEFETACNNEKVLLVEDDEAVRILASGLLNRLGYKVFEAGNGTQALALVKDRLLKPDLLLTDVIMPDMNGKELYQHISDHDPEVKVLFMSGYTGSLLNRLGVVENNGLFLEKPFTIKTLADKIRRVLDEKEQALNG
ncbi:MAG: hypothetical protein PWR01_2377 [Clostridiales bacterium]|nr:hypothetical protein [Clostridiales bacterium]MDN5281304.1 hypothetical protein [Candidatus Ozemobacter sp.]